MSEEDHEWIEARRKEYAEFYPHLKEPAMRDILDSYLKLLRQIDRMWAHAMSPDYPPDQVQAAMERIMRLVRSCSLLGARMGITYTSQRRQVQKEDEGVKLPEELLEEFTREKG